MNRLFSVRAGIVALCGTGCMVGPQYKRPSANTPPAFKEAPPTSNAERDGWKPGQPSDQLLKGDWWRMYQDPSLNSLEAQVNSANQTLKAAEANFRSARSAIRYARLECRSAAESLGMASQLYVSISADMIYR
jgi:outer membrane protein TolC